MEETHAIVLRQNIFPACLPLISSTSLSALSLTSLSRLTFHHPFRWPPSPSFICTRHIIFASSFYFIPGIPSSLTWNSVSQVGLLLKGSYSKLCITFFSKQCLLPSSLALLPPSFFPYPPVFFLPTVNKPVVRKAALLHQF